MSDLTGVFYLSLHNRFKNKVPLIIYNKFLNQRKLFRLIDILVLNIFCKFFLIGNASLISNILQKKISNNYCTLWRGTTNHNTRDNENFITIIFTKTFYINEIILIQKNLHILKNSAEYFL